LNLKARRLKKGLNIHNQLLIVSGKTLEEEEEIRKINLNRSRLRP
jgi:hypothetical protein